IGRFGLAVSWMVGRGVVREVGAGVTSVVPGDHVIPLYTPECRSLRSEEHTSELQSLMRISYAVFCLKKKTTPDLRLPKRLDIEHVKLIHHTTCKLHKHT